MPFNKLYDDIAFAREATGTSKSGAWFRGVSDGRYKLLPSLFRVPRRHPDAEMNIYADYWTMIDRSDITDEWQRLSFMQHHGVPTQLLDWTDNLNVAIFFAVAHAGLRGTGDPYIWVLNPYKLNELYGGERVVFDAADELNFSYYTSVCARQFPNETPIAMRPMWSNARIQRQSGAFTLHGQSEKPLEDQVSKQVAKRVSIQHAHVREIRTKIFDEGINDYSMMGGPEGLALYLKRRFLHPVDV